MCFVTGLPKLTHDDPRPFALLIVQGREGENVLQDAGVEHLHADVTVEKSSDNRHNEIEGIA